MREPMGVTALFLVLFVAVGTFQNLGRYQLQAARNAQLESVLSATGTPALGERTKSKDCEIRGALPDTDCTPGALFPDATLAQICVPGYTKTVRSVSAKMHEQVFAEYGIAYPQPHGSYEVDHLIPLAIGGSNDVANLFPEAAEPRPGFREKDLVEVYLQEEVCAGRADLSSAQKAIARDWLSIYKNLSPETIARLKSKYKSWSN